MPLWAGRLLVFVSFSMLLYILRTYWKRNFVLDTFDYFYLGGVLFTLATAAIVVYSRSGTGHEIMLTSRYKVYSALLLSFNVAYLTRLVSTTFREVLTITFVVAASFLYACNQHYHLYDAIQLRKFNISSSFNWRNDAPASNQSQIYTSPPLFLDKIAIAYDTNFVGEPCQVIDNNFKLTQADYRLYDLRDGGLYIVFTNKIHRYIFPTWQARKHSFRNVVNYKRFFIKSSTAIVPASEVKAGTYYVQWLHFDRGGKLYFEKATCQSVTFEEVTQKKIKTNW
ncbi:MAG: hypothetical protein R2822_06810 [Spirosomataceae bacterium]